MWPQYYPNSVCHTSLDFVFSSVFCLFHVFLKFWCYFICVLKKSDYLVVCFYVYNNHKYKVYCRNICLLIAIQYMLEGPLVGYLGSEKSSRGNNRHHNGHLHTCGFISSQRVVCIYIVSVRMILHVFKYVLRTVLPVKVFCGDRTRTKPGQV